MGRVKITSKLTKRILERDGPYCRYCGKPAWDFGWRVDIHGRPRVYVRGFALDHIVPVAKGGAHEAANLVLACDGCNQRKMTGPPPPLRPPHRFALAPPNMALTRDDSEFGPNAGHPERLSAHLWYEGGYIKCKFRRPLVLQKVAR